MPTILQHPIDTATHLSFKEQVNAGAFYTPQCYVDLVGEWLVKHGVGRWCTFFEPSCGYGAFFGLNRFFPDNRFVGNDVDEDATVVAKSRFPLVEMFSGNALSDVGRAKYGITETECLCIVGNPPWNDVSSQIRHSMKNERTQIDPDIATRDLGLSSLLAYNKLKADFVAVLHPLSYLVKRTNFSTAGAFFSNYRLLESLVFSSQRFSDTSRSAAFPVVVALYERAPQQGLQYEDVCKHTFKTEEGDTFRMSDREYIDSFMCKYPTSVRYSPEILFYTMRDVNALSRSRTFIKTRCANAVDVDPAKLDYYCYVDTFKAIAETPYWMGNLNVPLIANGFDQVASSFRRISQHNHPEIFGETPAPSQSDLAVARAYIRDVVSFRPDILKGGYHA